MCKSLFVSKSVLKKKIKKVWSRNSIIPFFLINTTVFVHNGKIFKKLVITREKVGYKFGEFVFTRKSNQLIKLKRKKSKKK